MTAPIQRAGGSDPIRVNLSSLGRFHFYSLASELGALGALDRLYTGYPKHLVVRAGVSARSVRSLPWLVAPRMAMTRRVALPARWIQNFDNIAQKTHDRWVAKNLRPADVFHGLSRYNLKAGIRAKALGAKYVCDVGSAHILDQVDILAREQDRMGVKDHWIHPEAIARELQEYEEADAIFLMSSFAVNSFKRRGVPEHKLRKIQPGINLSRFTDNGRTDPSVFRILFVGHIGVQKGVHVLAEAFKRAKLPNSELVLIGSVSRRLLTYIEHLQIRNVRILGHVPHDELPHHYRDASVFVLPSFQDGFGMVALEAMACGVPTVISSNAGASDLIEDGVNGYRFQAGDVDALTARIEQLYLDRKLRAQLGVNAASVAQQTHGWAGYAQAVIAHYEQLIGDARQ